jgi:hypothetical protein
MSTLSPNFRYDKLRRSNDILKTLLKEIYSSSRISKDADSKTYLKNMKIYSKTNSTNRTKNTFKYVSTQKILPILTESKKCISTQTMPKLKLSSSKSIRPQSPYSVTNIDNNKKITIISYESKNTINMLMNINTTILNKRENDPETFKKMRVEKAEHAKSIKERNRLLRENALIYKEKLKEESIQRIKLSILENKLMKFK